jgi:probable HAF family extracellular repeat protein
MKTFYSNRKILLASSAMLPAMLFLGHPAFAQDVFQEIGSLGGSYIYSGSVSADGSVVVGSGELANSYYDHAFRWKDGTMTDLGTLGGNYSYANGVSADGSVVVGYSTLGDGYSQRAFRWVDGTMTDLDTLGGSYSYANDVSADGSVVVGNSGIADNSTHAFRWNDGTMTDLGTLGGSYSYANGVSADGSVVVGYSDTVDYEGHAFRWKDGTMSDLGTLGGSYSDANDVSADGSVVVGHSRIADSYDSHAFRWIDGTMSDLGTLGGNYSSASGVSADGSVVVGISRIADSYDHHAFRWKDGTMTALGSLGEATARSVNALSADGTVLVGQAGGSGMMMYAKFSEESGIAYRWSEGSGLQSVADWVDENGGATPSGYKLTNATGVSADGTVVLGIGQYENEFSEDGPTDIELKSMYDESTQTFWLARGNGFLSDTAAFDRSVIQAGSASLSTALAATNLALEGAHHRTLLNMGIKVGSTGWFAWSTADAAKNDYTDTTSYLAETGIGRDIGDYRIGIAVGTTKSQQDWDLGGNAEFNGDYVLAEIARAFPIAGGSSIEASLLGYYATFDTELNRAYASGAGTDISTGRPDLQSAAIKARLDWVNAKTLGNVTLSPYAALTMTNAKVDGYTETGGAFPATYGDASSDGGDLRIGSAFTFETSNMISVRLGAEAVHQFQSDGQAVNGGVAGLYSFNLAGEERKSNWARVTLDADYALSPVSTLTGGLSMSTQGSQPTVGLTVGLRAAF